MLLLGDWFPKLFFLDEAWLSRLLWGLGFVICLCLCALVPKLLLVVVGALVP